MVTQMDFAVSAALKKEMEFFSETNEGQKLFDGFRSVDDLVGYVEASPEYRDIEVIAAARPTGKAIDIGVAYGVTSAYLAAKGWDVTCVEPSLRLCEDMERNFRRLGIRADIVNSTGEALTDLPAAADLVVFFSSLHHCDDVGKALRNARRALRDGGAICLYEPVLKCYRTKKWFYRTLEEHPEKLGHYGGNEHIYRFGEYARFLRDAGFSRRGCRAVHRLSSGAQAGALGQRAALRRETAVLRHRTQFCFARRPGHVVIDSVVFDQSGHQRAEIIRFIFARCAAWKDKAGRNY